MHRILRVATGFQVFLELPCHKHAFPQQSVVSPIQRMDMRVATGTTTGGCGCGCG